MKYYIIIVLLILVQAGSFAQKDINPNGYNVFYYQNGKISSEGYMKDGKPDGHWKNYYMSGVLKSEGNRKNFQLDSVWVFYDEDSDTINKINYLNGKRNGYTYNYEYVKKDNKKTGGLTAKELYLNDIKQGLSYYYENGILKYTIQYRDGKKYGVAKEYDADGNVITLKEYKNDFLIYSEYINRFDESGKKTGVWKELYPNDKVKTEATYFNDTISGFVKEFDASGKLLKMDKYVSGVLVEDSVKQLDTLSAKFVEEYYDNGNLKFKGAYLLGVPVGLHKEYDIDGKIISAKEYDNAGNVTSSGLVDESDRKQGTWKYYYEDGSLKAEGEFKDGKESGLWTFYYPGQKIEQKGKYLKGKPAGEWVWYYPDGKIWREENLLKGREDGTITEYNQDGKVILKGEYVDGEREGPWLIDNGDEREEGDYQAGLRNGIWKHYYKNGKLQYTGNFVQGMPDGKHRWYYETGRIMQEGYYSLGSKEKTWNKFDMEGTLYLFITYKNDKEYKVNGKKIHLPKGSFE